jgi:hypothetical protein
MLISRAFSIVNTHSTHRGQVPTWHIKDRISPDNRGASYNRPALKQLLVTTAAKEREEAEDRARTSSAKHHMHALSYNGESR